MQGHNVLEHTSSKISCDNFVDFYRTSLNFELIDSHQGSSCSGKGFGMLD
jgi:hypothetical protein